MSDLPPSLQARQDACTHKRTDPLFLAKNDLKKIAEAMQHPDRQTQYPLPANREKFCQLVAFNAIAKNEAYALSHDIEMFTREKDGDELYVAQMKALSSDASALMQNTTIRLRIAELRKPVVRKLQRKFEYDLQKALSQANIAWETAYEDGDTANMLKAIDMQSRLAKLLVEEVNVNHRYGVLDDASTAVLLGIRDEIEKKKTRQKRLQSSITVEHTEVSS
jgi:hypothetical protein